MGKLPKRARNRRRRPGVIRVGEALRPFGIDLSVDGPSYYDIGQLLDLADELLKIGPQLTDMMIALVREGAPAPSTLTLESGGVDGRNATGAYGETAGAGGASEQRKADLDESGHVPSSDAGGHVPSRHVRTPKPRKHAWPTDVIAGAIPRHQRGSEPRSPGGPPSADALSSRSDGARASRRAPAIGAGLGQPINPDEAATVKGAA